MPIGNGDIGLNVWTEQNGDLVFLIGKTDAYTENGQLVKLGRVRVRLTPSPFIAPAAFLQVLKVGRGNWTCGATRRGRPPRSCASGWTPTGPSSTSRGAAASRLSLQASVELWRLEPREIKQGSVELEGQGTFRELNNSPVPVIAWTPTRPCLPQRNRLAWCHFNARSTYPVVLQNQHLESLLTKYPDPLLHRTFGVGMKGPGLVSEGNLTLRSARPQPSFRLDLYALTQRSDSPAQWRAALDRVIAQADATPLEAARAAHRQWWATSGTGAGSSSAATPDAEKVTQSYAMQRWMDACGGRGSLCPSSTTGPSSRWAGRRRRATMTRPKGSATPTSAPGAATFGRRTSARSTGRWSHRATTTCSPPTFAMYRNDLPMEEDRARLYYGHAGAAYPETMYFWGTPNNNDFGWGNKSPMSCRTPGSGTTSSAGSRRRHDAGRVRKHAGRLVRPEDAAAGRRRRHHLLRPALAARGGRQDTHGPRPGHRDLPAGRQPDAGHRRTPRHPAAPPCPASRPDDARAARDVAETADGPAADPLGRTGPDGKLPKSGSDNPSGRPTILPAEKYSGAANVENPELYAVFPFRRYGVGFPDLDLARTTFAARAFKSSTCWGQDGEDAALLGLADDARSEVTANFTAYGGERFKWFWKTGPRLGAGHGQRGRGPVHPPTDADAVRRPAHPAPARLARRLGLRLQAPRALPDHGPRG